MSKPYPETPELERMKAVTQKSQSIGDFIEWLDEEKNLVLCYRPATAVNPVDSEDEEGEYFPAAISMTDLLAEFFQIDLNKVEEERAAVLKWVNECYEEDHDG